MHSKTAARLLFSSALLCGIAHAGCPSKLPTVTLPWGTVSPTECDGELGVYIFRNVRFGKPTDGKNGGTPRFGVPEAPDKVSNPEQVILTAPKGPTACLQVPWPGPDCKAGEGDAPNYGGPILAPGRDVTSSEDCLFLDIYVPISAVDNAQTSKLPVVVWFYGGAYVFGAKDFGISKGLTFYDGRGLIEAADNKDIIYVAGNYRLAHLGWLAGPAVSSSESTAIPNAGLADQRLLLDFVQNNIAKFGGDPTKVTAFGESAGAGSILHHLIATNPDGSRRDPLFHRAITQSAAFQWIWDNSATGAAQATFADLVSRTSCGNGSKSDADALACLQGLESSEMDEAVASFWNAKKCTGIFNLGPVVDGVTIRQLPATALESPGFKFHKNVKGLIASHVKNEAHTFVPKWVTSDSAFDQLLESFLPGNSSAATSQRACISKQYSAFPDAQKKAKNVIQDSMFVCNVRYAYDAAARQSLPVWLMDYAFYGDYLKRYDFAFHATDLVPTFWSRYAKEAAFVKAICNAATGALKPMCPGVIKAGYLSFISKMRLRYQKYFVAFIKVGDPNKSGNSHTWKTPTEDHSSGKLGGVLQVSAGPFNFFSDEEDQLTKKTTCQFWSCMAGAVTNGRSGEECGCGGPSAPKYIIQEPEAEQEQQARGDQKDEL
ncbi:Alpha/Beta hydrolase protein [Cladorrhinum samala]|uniref:Alpha/Beta hydrolase protein n=1 Tax=Cladorrhinum samala TaxID=585594 RepID=A0AAV9I089_9PEZI|nr:Alpha/Beta hydrolase protein [Cladorrhinum samala]